MSAHSEMAGKFTTEQRPWIRLSDVHWPFVLLLYVVVGLISAGTVYTADLASGHPRPYLYPFIWEMTGHGAAFLMLPLIVLAFSNFPITGRNWHWTVPLHLGFSVVVGILHTYLMYFSRQAVYAVLGLGTYNYGHMGYILLMEYQKQFLHYWLVYAVARAMFYYRQSRERERDAAALELRTSELNRQLAQAQLQSLRSQLNPHFLFNTLNMVSSVMYEDVDRADHMLAALSRMLRLSLDEEAAAETPLRRELDFLEAARELLAARFQDRFELEVQCPRELAEAPVPHLLLHTMVENAIKHHRGEPDPVIRVAVRVEASGDTLHLHVTDNGPGISEPETVIGKGVGLANARARLEALYGARFKFELLNRPEGGLHVHIALPLRSAKPRDLVTA